MSWSIFIIDGFMSIQMNERKIRADLAKVQYEREIEAQKLVH